VAAAPSRYGQSRDRSGELLRLSLPHMSRHPAAFNPRTYAVWYEHMAGMNVRLSAAIEERLAAVEPLDDAAIERLHREHVDGADAATAERVSGSMRGVMDELGQSAAEACSSAAEVAPRLAALGAALQRDDAAAFAQQVDGMLTSTRCMQGAVDALRDTVAASQREIERLRNELHRTREQAALCPLTRVHNRKGFDDQLHAMFESPRGRPASLCVAMIDIDHFKRVNDEHGHLMGDRVLEALGQLLLEKVRSPGAIVARYGGEEFVLVLPGFAVEEAAELANVLRAGVPVMPVRQRPTDRRITGVTISVGVTAARAGDDATTLIARADAALYQAKRSGRDRVTVA
jgi:diguanylate cyclase